MQTAMASLYSLLSQLQAQVAALHVWTSRLKLFGPEKPKVVIVGAGPGGLNAARGLNGHADVTIIDGKDYHELNSGTLQTFVAPHQHKKVLIDYEDIPDIGRMVKGRVLAVHEDHVTVDNGALTGPWDLAYEWLILAPGSTYAEGPIKAFCHSLEERQNIIQQEHARLRSATSILIIGGGIVGVELAGEVLSKMPNKKITLLTSGERLIADKPAEIGVAAKDHLERQGVEIYVNTRASKNADGVYSTADGRSFDAEIVYMTVGGKPNTDFLKGGLVPLNAKGFIEVTECLQVKGYHNIYALGDATDIKETKLGYLAAAHARLTAMNLRRRFRYGDAAEQQVWIPFGGFEFVTGEAMMFTLGRPDGVAHASLMARLKRMGRDGWFSGWLRAKEKYTVTTRQNLGVSELEPVAIVNPKAGA
eukprot:TRINITY_DN846_c0_g1_i2.p1 TRINITY_DN846_c0_g1~~TRINITY_DN846_c0_g1_i2.p1  ORF type:complete len:419 (+),score=66.90 TRINITY_DN846_c0_g1_i2:419-1675(+)